MKSVHYILYILYAAIISSLASSAYSQTKFHPIQLSSVSGNMDASQANAILEVFSQSLALASKTTYARATYANNLEAFNRKAKSYPGQLGPIVDTLDLLDSLLAENFSKYPRQLVPKSKDLIAEQYWTTTDIGEHIVSPAYANVFFGLLSQYGKNRIENEDTIASLGSILSQTKTAPFNNENRKKLHEDLFHHYAEFQDFTTASDYAPMYVKTHLKFAANAGVSVSIKMGFAAKPFSFVNPPSPSSTLDKGVYNPALQGRGMYEISFDRNYLFGMPNSTLGNIMVSFGQMLPNSYELGSCKGDKCLRWTDALPTFYLKTSQADTKLNKFMAWLASFDQFKILFRKVAIGLKSKTMASDQSELVFVVQDWGGGEKVIDQSRTAPHNFYESFVQVDNVINKNVLPGVQDALSAQVNRALETDFSNYFTGSNH
jgi:hypothetical protein